MTTSDMIRELCDRMNISQAFVLPDGDKIMIKK